MLKILTDRAIEKAQPDGRNHMVSDRQALGKGRGALVLRISPAGARTWYFRRTVAGRTAVFPMGAWAADDVAGMSVGTARVRARELADLCQREGIADLAEHFERKRAEAEAAQAAARAAEEAQRRAAETVDRRTVRALLAVYVAHQRRRNKSSAADVERLFRAHIDGQAIASRPAALVTTKEVTDALRLIVEAGKGRTAAKVRSYMRAAWQLALRAGTDASLPAGLDEFDIESNPVASTVSLSQFSRARKRTLTDDELAALLAALEKVESPQGVAARLLLLLGGQRPMQLLRARVEDWNASSRTLTLHDPKGRRATPRVHVVPVEGKARPLLGALVERAAASACPWLFTTDLATPMRAETVNAVVVAQCKAFAKARHAADPDALPPTPYSARDIRSTVETLLASRGVSREVRAQLLSHGLGGVQARHYDAHEYLDEKREAILTLHRHLDALVAKRAAPRPVKRRSKAAA